MVQDVNFDGRAERFVARIYGSAKGELRLLLVWEDMLARLPLAAPLPGRVWDVGGGAGHLSERLLTLGHPVLLSDLSTEMLALAAQRLEPLRCSDTSLELRQGSLQEVADELAKCGETFPLITCHAVLEWLSDPAQALRLMAARLAQDGQLSLMFYNRDALVLTHVVRGNVDKLLSGNLAGHPGGLTPPNPVAPADVERWLTASGLRVTSRFGVRSVTDHLPRPVRAVTAVKDQLALERRYGQQSPFRELARYQHWICQKG